MNTISIDNWLTAMIEATDETATQTLGFESVAGKHTIGEQPVDKPGSFISLASENDSVQIGLVSNKEGLELLAKSMLGMTPEEEIAQADITDAVGEIINIVAGGVKRRLNEQAGGMKLGLPMFIDGKIAQGGSQELACANLNLGNIPAHLLVLRKKG